MFGIECKLASLPHGVAQRFDENISRLFISDVLAPETALFAVAHRLAILSAEHQINEIIEQSTLPEEGDAPLLARNVLASYFSAALVMPYEPFLRACREFRYDVERISRRFGASFEQVCHRMTTLQRPGAQGIPMHLVRTDIAGNISKRFSLSGIHIPRHSGACPRWNIYSAFLQPEKVNIQISQMPDGETYFCIAKSIAKGGYRHNAPRRHLSIGLGVPYFSWQGDDLCRWDGPQRHEPSGAHRCGLPYLPAARMRPAGPSASGPSFPSRQFAKAGKSLCQDELELDRFRLRLNGGSAFRLRRFVLSHGDSMLRIGLRWRET